MPNALGRLYARLVRGAATLGRFYGQLGREATILVLPLLPIFVLGSSKLPTTLFFLLGLAVVILLSWYVIQVGWSEARKTLSDSWKSSALALVVILAASWLLGWIVARALGLKLAVGDLPLESRVFYLGLAFWVAAIAVCLGVFSFRSLAGLTAAVGAAVGATGAVIGQPVVLALGLIALVFAPAVGSQDAWRGLGRRARTWRLGATLLSVAAMAVIAVSLTSIRLIDRSVGGYLAGRAQAAARPGQDVPGVMRALQVRHYYRDRWLAYAFLPHLYLSREQTWLPADYSAFAVGSKVIYPDGTAHVVTEAAAFPALGGRQVVRFGVEGENTCPPGIAAPCLVLRRGCFQQSSRCGSFNPDPGRRITRAAVYVRVVHRGQPRPGYPDPFAGASEAERHFDGRRIEVVLQYWVFYLFDRTSATLPIGRLVQEHEADWEAITIGLAKKEPLFVAYSAHCGGTWRPWSEVPVEGLAGRDPRTGEYEPKSLVELLKSGTVDKAGLKSGRALLAALVREPTHPAAMVAEGSHAMYPVGGDEGAPDWASCTTLPSQIADLASFAGNVRERVRLDARFVSDSPVLVSERTWPMAFPGNWGVRDQITVEGIGKHPWPLQGDEERPGPASPPFQPLWRSPLKSIFGSDRWHGG